MQAPTHKAPPLLIAASEVEWTAIRAQGPGGQNVNKVSSAVHLRFDIKASSLPEHIQQQLLSKNDQRLTRDGVFIIKAQRSRTQENNLADAMQRLQAWVNQTTAPITPRRTTQPTWGSKQRRLQYKAQRSNTKQLRKPSTDF